MGAALAGMGTAGKQTMVGFIAGARDGANKIGFLNAASDTSFGTSCDYLCRRKKATADQLTKISYAEYSSQFYEMVPPKN